MSHPCINSAHSGIGGVVVAFDHFRGQRHRVARLLSWNFEATANFVEWYDNGAYGQRWVARTTFGISGGFEFVHDSQSNTYGFIQEGGSFGLLLYLHHNINFPQLGFSHRYIPMAMITRVAFSCDVRTGQVVEGEANFIGSGPFFAQLPPPDNSPIPEQAASVGIQIPKGGNLITSSPAAPPEFVPGRTPTPPELGGGSQQPLGGPLPNLDEFIPLPPELDFQEGEDDPASPFFIGLRPVVDKRGDPTASFRSESGGASAPIAVAANTTGG